MTSLSNKIQSLFESDPDLNQSDPLLIATVYSKFYQISAEVSFRKIIELIKEDRLPTFETIIRARRRFVKRK